ncbi:MAG: metallophosphatase family protein [Bacteroidales bacterium]|nr:metallophosphatase family protein [Bacteroidales bacterium]
MMFIGLLSDTHGVFEEPFRKFFEPVDEIWHAGDFGGGYKTIAEIAAFKPTVGVVGNCDERNLIFDYPIYKSFEREGMRILMTHIGGYPGKYDQYARKLIDQFRPDIFVCGHSHILKVVNDQRRNMLVINPGAAGIQGFHLVRTALRFHIDEGRIHDMEVFELERR